MTPNSIRNLWVALIAVAIIAIIGIFTPVGQTIVEKVEKAGTVSGVTNFSKLGVIELKIGTACGDGFTYSGCTGVVMNAASGFVSGLLATFDAGVLMSYTNSTSTTATSQTLAAADITNYSTVVMTPNTGALTLTFPASSTLSAFVPTAGDWSQQCWVNATGTAAAKITFAAGTGIDLEVASSSLIIYPGNTGCFRYIRKPATATTFDIVAQFSAFVDGD